MSGVIQKIKNRINGFTVEDRLCCALIAAAALFNLIFLFHETSLPVPNLNDNVFHYALIERADAAVAAKENPFDHWVPYWVMGYPVFHYYQHLPHLFVVALHKLAFNRIDLFTLFNWIKYLLPALFPISVFIGLRKLGFEKIESALSALCSSLISSNLYGFSYSSYVWQGFGMYTQLWGMILLPICIGQTYSTVKNGTGYFKSVFCITLLLLSHVVYCYIAVLSLLAISLLKTDRTRFIQRAGRLLTALILGAVVSSYFLIPYFINGSYLNRSVWEAREKYDSYGHKQTIEKLFNGDLLDLDRFPVFTLLMFIGLAQALTKKRDSNRIVVALFFLWLLLYFGRPTWGTLLELLPLSGDLHLHRFIGGIHLAAIALIGIGIQTIWNASADWSDKIFALYAKPRTRPSAIRHIVVALSLLGAILIPAYRERIVYLKKNRLLLEKNLEAFNREERNINDLMGTLRDLQKESPARTYAGLPAGWGGRFTVGDVPMYALLSAQTFDVLGPAYHALSFNSDIQFHFNEGDPAHYRLFNVGYVVAPAERSMPEFLKVVKTIGGWILYKTDASGYFDAVRSDIAFYGSRSDMYRAGDDWLKGGLFKAKEHPSIFFDKKRREYKESIEIDKQDLKLPSAESLSQWNNEGSVLSSKAENSVYTARVKIESSCFLLLKATYHPQWRAVVDGAEREIVMLAPSFIGVRMEPGEHKIEFRYEPAFYKSLLVALGIAVLIAIYFLENRPKSTRL